MLSAMEINIHIRICRIFNTSLVFDNILQLPYRKERILSLPNLFSIKYAVHVDTTAHSFAKVLLVLVRAAVQQDFILRRVKQKSQSKILQVDFRDVIIWCRRDLEPLDEVGDPEEETSQGELLP